MSSRTVYVGVGAIILHDGKVLLIRRQNQHGRGTWSTPGGYLELGESPEDCAIREAKEEVGADIEHVRFRALTNDVFPSGDHFITLWMEGRLIGEGLIAAPDAEEVAEIGWFTWDALPEPLFAPFANLVEGRCYPSPDRFRQGLHG